MAKKTLRTTVGEMVADIQQEFMQKCYIGYGEGKEFELLSYGLCQWTKVAFVRDGVELYKLTRAVSSRIDDEKSERKEYFHGKLVRKYKGKQNCFIEFCDFLQVCDEKSMRQKVASAARALKLSMETAKLYGLFYKRFFCS